MYSILKKNYAELFLILQTVFIAVADIYYY